MPSFIDTTRLQKRSQQNPSGIDRVIVAYTDWLKNRSLDCIELQYDFYGVSLASEPKRSVLKKINLSTLQIGTRRTALKRKNPSEIYEYNYKKLSVLDISVDLNKFKVSKKLMKHLKLGEQSVYFSIGHDVLLRKSYLEWLSSIKEMKKVFFIHDTIPLDFPDFCREEEQGRHKLRIHNAHCHADVLVVNSLYTADRLAYWRDFWSLKEVPIHILHIGVEQSEKPITVVNQSMSDPYFVILGTVEPRKNHLLLINIWLLMLETMPIEQIPKLLIIGRIGWKVKEVERILKTHSALQQVVELKENITDEELWPIIKKSRALLFPSFVEGWGMPLVEALSLQVPAICSDIPSLKEAGQGMAEYCSPTNGEDWKEKILEFAHHPEKSRAEQLHRLKKFKAPTWEEHFEKLEDIIQEL